MTPTVRSLWLSLKNGRWDISILIHIKMFRHHSLSYCFVTSQPKRPKTTRWLVKQERSLWLSLKMSLWDISILIQFKLFVIVYCYIILLRLILKNYTQLIDCSNKTDPFGYYWKWVFVILRYWPKLKCFVIIHCHIILSHLNLKNWR